MDQLQADQLHTMLRGLIARLQTLEAGAIQAVNKAVASEQMAWDLYTQLVTHDHCELCGAAVWGTEHTC